MLKAKKLTLLNGVTLSCELNAGELKILQGPNGSGKSVFLRSLALLHRSDCESYVFQSTPVSQFVPQAFRRRVLYVPPVPLDTAGTVANFFQAPWKLAIAAGNRPLAGFEERLKDAGFWERDFSLLSSGEKQYVQLLRAFSMDAQVLLLDETMAHMDQQRRSQVEALLQEQLQQGRAAIVISHDNTLPERIHGDVWHFTELLS